MIDEVDGFEERFTISSIPEFAVLDENLHPAKYVEWDLQDDTLIASGIVNEKTGDFHDYHISFYPF